MKLIRGAILSLVMLLITFAAHAQTYPYSNPTYIPNAVFPTITMASATPSSAMQLNGTGTLGVQITGSCASFTSALQGTVDGTNYTTVNLYPSTALSSASAVASVSALGVYAANVTGYSKVRLNTTAQSGTACVASLVGIPVSFSLPR